MFADSVLKALSNYPIVESAVALLILLAGWKIMNSGKKDGPAPVSSYPHEYPFWLMSGPVHDTMVHIAAMKHETVRCREELQELNARATRTVQLLEYIQNENIINPRRLQE